MRIKIISVGKLSAEVKLLTDQYQKMTGWRLESCILNAGKNINKSQIKLGEAKLIKSHLDVKAFIIALDLTGIFFTSEEFSQFFCKLMLEGQTANFIVGGVFGLDTSILTRAHLTLSLSKMTLPRQLAKLILFEQIYRAYTITQNHPYHK